jgi:hypothetical protein
LLDLEKIYIYIHILLCSRPLYLWSCVYDLQSSKVKGISKASKAIILAKKKWSLKLYRLLFGSKVNNIGVNRETNYRTLPKCRPWLTFNFVWIWSWQLIHFDCGFFIYLVYAFVCSTKRNQCVILMISHGRKNCAIDNFVKFGSGNAMHHNHAMPKECIFDVPPNSLKGSNVGPKA